MTRDELKGYLEKNLLTSVQVAEILGISKQMLANHVKSQTIDPILSTSQGNMFLRSDINDYLDQRIKNRMQTDNLEEDRILSFWGSGDKSVAFFKENRVHLGTIANIHIYFDEFDAILNGHFKVTHSSVLSPHLKHLATPKMVIRDFEGNEIWLSGCNCGYGGTGPNCSNAILNQIGVPEELAESVYSSPLLAYYWDQDDGWNLNRQESQIREMEKSSHRMLYDISARIYLKDNRLVLLQQLLAGLHYDYDPYSYMVKYSQFIPCPKKVYLLTNDQAHEYGYVGFDPSGFLRTYNLIIVDKSDRELWLCVPVDDNTPLHKQYSLLELLKKCGYCVDNTESFADKLKTWLGIIPARANVCELKKF